MTNSQNDNDFHYFSNKLLVMVLGGLKKFRPQSVRERSCASLHLDCAALGSVKISTT